MDDKKISRKGFFALLLSGFAGIFLAQLPSKTIFTQKDGSNYGNNTYGGNTR